MASKTLLILLGLAMVAVAFAAWEEKDMQELEEDEQLSMDDLQEYFTAQQMEKRGAKKVGSCLLPNGSLCVLCNLKVKNRNDMRRYIACSSAGKGRKL